jgi:hypothetical protein
MKFSKNLGSKIRKYPIKIEKKNFINLNKTLFDFCLKKIKTTLSLKSKSPVH